ncbi:hypothetical protein GS538_11785 [Rhodococcus hoagii]|nr:hypothetical protein [Prescottella equi]NKV46361.1 hypothetical protein [Prescottella equi]
MNPTAEVDIGMMLSDRINQLGWLLTNVGRPEAERSPFPPTMHMQILAAKARARADAEAETTVSAKRVVDIRTKINQRRAGLTSDRPKRPPNPQARAVRDRLTQARAAVNQ